MKATEACCGLRPVANALGEWSGITQSFGMGRPMRWRGSARWGRRARRSAGSALGETGWAEYILQGDLVREEVAGEIHHHGEEEGQ